MSLVWDFYREIGSDPGVKVGGVVHYFDETAQTLFLNNGLKTRLSAPLGGSWRTAELSSPSQFITAAAYGRLTLDHPVNGTLYMAGIIGGQLQFMRYQYASDLSAITEQVTYTAQVDNQITQISASISNISNDWFDADGTLFNPGAKIALGVAYGDSETYQIGVAYMDDFEHDPKGTTVPISGRNAIGYFLKEATFGGQTSFAGTYPEICAALAALAGVPKFKFQAGSGVVEYTYKPENTLLDGFNSLNEIVYYNSSNPMRLTELADGTVISGSEAYLSSYVPNTYYTFTVGREVQKRKTKKSADAAYAGVYVTGKDAAHNDLTPVELTVPGYRYWNVPAKKLKHISAPDGWVASQADLQWYAEQEVKKLQYIGIGEEFTMALRPQLLVGDVAEISENGVGITLGIITEVKHTIGKNGFFTDFSVDSGGEVTTTAGGVRTVVSGAYGFTRRPRISDYIKLLSGR